MNLITKNTKILEQRNQTLANLISSNSIDAQTQLQAGKTQYPTLLVQTQNGISALHHPDDPIGYCQNLLNSIADLTAKHNIILMGCGLGYLPLLLHQSHQTFRNLFVLEPSVSVFRQALQTIDLTALLGDRRVHFIVGTDHHKVYQELMPYVIDFMANPPLLIDQPPITNTFPEWAQEARQQINAIIQFGTSGLTTKMKDGLLTLTNLFQNMDTIQSSPGIKPFARQCKEIPAVIVAAGPSLIKNIDRLVDYQDHALIFATDTALETCLNHNIKPQFVVTVDPTELNLKHFKTEMYDSSIRLLFDPEARPEIPAKFHETRTYCTDKHEFFTWLDEQTGGKGIIKKGSMVSQAGIYMASYFGCDPIILIGQDLALEPNTGATHTGQAANTRKARFIDDEKNYVEVSTIEDETKNTREQLFWVEGVDGSQVPTMHNFLVYINMLAEDIKQTNAAVIDATEGGAKIHGTEIMTLSDALQQYASSNRSVVSHIRSIMEKNKAVQPGKKQDIKKQLKDLLQSRLNKAQKGREYLKNKDQISLAALERKLEEYRIGLMSNPVAEYIIENGAPKELFEYLKLCPANAGDKEKKANAIKRFESLLNAVESSAERLLDQLG